MISGFAFTLIAYSVSHDVIIAGMVGMVFALCEGLSTLPGGYLADHADRKQLLIFFGVTSTIILVVMSAALLTGWMTTPLLFLFAVLRGLTSGLFSNISNIVLPQILTGNQLVQAYSANQSRDACIQLFAKPFSGFLYGLGPEVPFLLSAIMYILMSITTPLIRADLHPSTRVYIDTNLTEDDDGNSHITRTVEAVQDNTAHDAHPTGAQNNPKYESSLAGFTWYARHPQALSIFGSVLLINCVITLLVGIMILDQQTLQTPGVLIGLISTGSGIGLLSGAFLTAPLSQHYTGGRIVQISVLVILLGCVFQPYTHQVYVLIICMTVTNLMIVPANSILGSYSDLIIPNALRGRVTSIFALCNIVLGSVSSAVAGILLAVIGYRNAMNTAVAAVLVTVLVTFTSRGIRDIPSRDQFSNLTPWE